MFDTALSGIEGGIHYWAKVVAFWTPARSGIRDEFGTGVPLVCDLVELESAEQISLRDQWATGLRLMAER